MASASSLLSEEFKCPIHLYELVDPKIMGPCFHTACLECVSGLVRASDRRGVFSCPVCREDCRIPAGGVQNLKDNFHLKSIMDRYRNVQENTAGIKCIACGNAASHFCKKCENIYLCPSCSRKHDLNPETADHQLIGICKEHGKTLSKFCRGCNQAICSVCRISTHSGSGNHDVTSHEEVVDEATTRVADEVVTLEGKLMKKEQHQNALQQIHDSAIEKIESDLGKLAEKTDSVIAIYDRKHEELSIKRRNLQEQLNAVEESLSETEKKRTDVQNTNEEYCLVLRNQRNIHLAKLKTLLAQHAKGMAEVQTTIDLAHTVTSRQRVLDDKTVPNLVHVSDDLQKLSIVAEHGDDVNSFLHIESRMVRFVLGDDQMEIGHLGGEIQMPEYTSVEKVTDLSFPPDLPCHRVRRLKHYDDGRVVSLYQTGEGRTICLHDTTSPGKSSVTIKRDIEPAVDMTITSTGEVMVLRRTEPAIQAIDINTGTLSDIRVCFGDKLVRKNRGIETDDEGNMFVLNGGPYETNSHLLVFNTEGNLIHNVQIHGFAMRATYSRSRKKLYAATLINKIVRYRWSGSMLVQLSSLSHGVEGFDCVDICTGSAGEVFVSGLMKANDEIRIYQVLEAEDRREEQECGTEPASVAQSGNDSSQNVSDEANEAVNMIRINFSDNTLRRSRITPPVYQYEGQHISPGSLVLAKTCFFGASET